MEHSNKPYVENAQNTQTRKNSQQNDLV